MPRNQGALRSQPVSSHVAIQMGKCRVQASGGFDSPVLYANALPHVLFWANQISAGIGATMTVFFSWGNIQPPGFGLNWRLIASPGAVLVTNVPSRLVYEHPARAFRLHIQAPNANDVDVEYYYTAWA